MKLLSFLFVLFWSTIAISADPRFALERHPKSGVVLKFVRPKMDIEKLITSQWAGLEEQLSLLQAQGLEQSQMQVANELNVIAGSLPHSLANQGLSSALQLDLSAQHSFIEQSVVFGDFKEKLKEFLLIFDPRVLAVEKDPMFYLKNQIAQDLLEKAIAQARRLYPSSKELMFLEQFMRLIVDRLNFEREFAQNMLMIEMMETPNSALTLSEQEKHHLLSSIYSSRTPLTTPQVQKDFKTNWATKGLHFYQSLGAKAQAKDQVLKGQAKSWANLNTWYAQGELPKGQYVLDLLHAPRFFRLGASVSHDFAKPERIFALRLLLRLAEIGLGVVAEIPPVLKNYGIKFLRSYYYEQIRLEGALISSLETQGNHQLSTHIWRQSFYLP